MSGVVGKLESPADGSTNTTSYCDSSPVLLAALDTKSIGSYCDPPPVLLAALDTKSIGSYCNSSPVPLAAVDSSKEGVGKGAVHFSAKEHLAALDVSCGGRAVQAAAVGEYSKKKGRRKKSKRPPEV